MEFLLSHPVPDQSDPPPLDLTTDSEFELLAAEDSEGEAPGEDLESKLLDEGPGVENVDGRQEPV